MSQVKVAEEVAAEEFLRMCRYNRVETDTSQLDEKELASWNDLRKPILRDITRGLLVIDVEGRAIYTPPGGKSVTFDMAKGSSLIALETHGEGKNISNTLAAAADMTGSPPGTFAGWHVRDVQALVRLVRLFLADQ